MLAEIFGMEWYKVHEEAEHRPPLDIIADLESLEAEIQTGLSELKAHLR